MLSLTPVLLIGMLSGIEWSADYDAALALAKAEGRAVFIAINMDGERANETLAKKTYQEKGIVQLSERTVNLIASRDEHSGGSRSCPRFAGVSCAEHQAIDKRVRAEVVKSASAGWVVAPQHVFLKPTGEVILSVPYKIGESELTWCFLAALRAVDAEFKTTGGRAPRRLILGDVFDPGSDDPSGFMGREQALELLEEAKRTSRDEMSDLFYRLITADEPEAIAFAQSQFGSRWMTYYGNETLAKCIRGVGETSPSSYWTVIVPQAKDGDPTIRGEAAVALEQLAAPKSLKDVLTAYKKEKTPEVKKDWIRAAAAVGASDRGARKTVLKAAGSPSKKAHLLRINAIVAAGSLDPGEDVAELLTTLLGDDGADVRRAAACAMAVSRERAFEGALDAALGTEADAAAKATFTLALSVLRGEGKLSELGKEIGLVASDTIPRQRIFGW